MVPQAEIVALADLHLKNFDPLGRGTGVENTRTQRKLSILKAAAQRAVGSEAKDRLLILCGDIFDSARIDEGIRAAYSEIVGTVLSDGVNVVHIIGNHPRVGMSVPLVSEFRMLKGVNPGRERETGEYTLVHGGTDGVDGVEIGHWSLVFVPFMPTEELEEGLKRMIVPSSRPYGPESVLLFSHFSVRGAWMTDSLSSEAGVDPELLKPFKGVFLGDFHRRHLLSSCSVAEIDSSVDKVLRVQNFGDGKFHCYLGSAAAVNFGEVDYPHSLAVIKLYDYPEWDVEFVDTEDSPMRLVEYSVDQIQNDFGKDEIPDGALIKLRIYGTRSELVEIDTNAVVREIYDQGAEHVSLEVVPEQDETSPGIETDTDFKSDPEVLVKELAGDNEGRLRFGSKILQSAIGQS